jgi:hypothetical protein
LKFLSHDCDGNHDLGAVMAQSANSMRELDARTRCANSWLVAVTAADSANFQGVSLSSARSD